MKSYTWFKVLTNIIAIALIGYVCYYAYNRKVELSGEDVKIECPFCHSEVELSGHGWFSCIENKVQIMINE